MCCIISVVFKDKINSQAACARFVVLCRQLGLFGSSRVAINGSKFKALNTRDKNFTAYKVKRRIEQVG